MATTCAATQANACWVHRWSGQKETQRGRQSERERKNGGMREYGNWCSQQMFYTVPLLQLHSSWHFIKPTTEERVVPKTFGKLICKLNNTVNLNKERSVIFFCKSIKRSLLVDNKKSNLNPFDKFIIYLVALNKIKILQLANMFMVYHRFLCRGETSRLKHRLLHTHYFHYWSIWHLFYAYICILFCLQLLANEKAKMVVCCSSNFCQLTICFSSTFLKVMHWVSGEKQIYDFSKCH